MEQLTCIKCFCSTSSTLQTEEVTCAAFAGIHHSTQPTHESQNVIKRKDTVHKMVRYAQENQKSIGKRGEER